jgi:hypothetical protein
MKQVYFSKLKTDSERDIIYEVFSLACSIYTAIQKDKTVVVVDSERFDLDYLTQSLKKYNMRVLEKKSLDYSLIAVFYGKGQKVLDITDKVPPLCTGSFNQIHGDPCPNESKELFMGYTLNGIEYTDIYKESDEGCVLFDVKEAQYNHDYFWLDKVNMVVYEEILKHIRVKDVVSSTLCHVFHVLSMEDIEPYARQLYKTSEEYYDTLLNKYMEIMSIFIKSDNDPIILIQKSVPSRLETFLKKKGNPYKVLDIQDSSTYVQVAQSSGILVGNFNMDTLTGSACSFYLHKMMPSSHSILIDLAMIYQE